MKLTDAECQVAINALRVAAEEYAKHAKTCANLRVGEQFDRQASEARVLADKLEDRSLEDDADY